MQLNWEVVGFLISLVLVDSVAGKCHPEMCGSTILSYPFWINNSNCGYSGYQIKCKEDDSTGKLAPFLPAYVGGKMKHFKIMEINYTGYLIINSTSLKAWSCNRYGDAVKLFQLPRERPFTISTSNRFVVIGCHTAGSYTYGGFGDVRCISGCESQHAAPYCNYGCCEIVLPDNWKRINFKIGKNNSRFNNDDQQCGFSTMFDPSTFTVLDNKTDLFGGESNKASYGLRLNWGIGLQNCSMAKATANYSCSVNAECRDSPNKKGHVCKCLPGYEGNGYANGTACTDVDECSYIDLNQCVRPQGGGICHNFPGSYNCSCAKGYIGDGFQNRRRCQARSSNNSVMSAIIGSISSVFGVSLVACGLFWWLRKRHLKLMREKYFQDNGGIELQNRIVSMGGRKSLIIFSENELEIASNNYSTKLGKGGFATVYKGILLDSTPVAIKKPKAISGEFINEVMILSHINHRNVVKLLGCCLETQYPLLVYEFVPNQTLFEHLHSAQNNLPWETRRQIAIETADAIAYMHLQASHPIFHRDIKSSNILLDSTFTPKVADFGISRLRPWDETHLSTMAVGTRGYLDPEFVRSQQFTDKSDVFSFGVVLVELLTGLKPLLSVQEIVYTLYDHFVSAMNEDRLIEVLDHRVADEENQWQMENMARLARACLQMQGRARPSMRAVVEELAWIRAAYTTQPRVYRDVALLDRRDTSTEAPLNYFTWQATAGSTSENFVQHYYTSPPPMEIASEDPSSPLIQTETANMAGGRRHY